MANLNEKLRAAFRGSDDDYDEDEYEEYEEDEEEEEEDDDDSDEESDDELERELLKEEKVERVPVTKATKVYKESKEKRKRRNIFLGIFYVLITLACAFAILFFLKNTRSMKEKYREQGIEAYKNGKYDEAIQLFHDSINEKQWFSENMDVDTSLYVAACHIQKKEYDSAIGIYESLISSGKGSINRDEVIRLKYLAEALLDVSSGNLTEDNIEALRIAAESGDTGMYLYVAAYYGAQKDSESMVSYIEKYLEANPLNTYCAYELSNYYLNQGNLDKAKILIDQGLSAGDDFYLDHVQFNLAVYYEKMGDMENALEIVTELHNKYPENTEYKSEYDFLYTRLNVDPEPVHKEEDD